MTPDPATPERPLHPDDGYAYDGCSGPGCQAIRAAAPVTVIDVERLRSAYYKVAEWSMCPDPEAIAAEYDARAEKETA